MLIITAHTSELFCVIHPKFGSNVNNDDAKHIPRGYERSVNYLMVFFCGKQDVLPKVVQKWHERARKRDGVGVLLWLGGWRRRWFPHVI